MASLHHTNNSDAKPPERRQSGWRGRKLYRDV
jgi:hypothetical protein